MYAIIYNKFTDFYLIINFLTILLIFFNFIN